MNNRPSPHMLLNELQLFFVGLPPYNLGLAGQKCLPYQTPTLPYEGVCHDVTKKKLSVIIVDQHAHYNSHTFGL